MQEKIKAYLDSLFTALPDTQDVREAKEELYTGMVERYNDCLAEGMDGQEAYDAVIDSMGDLHEYFDELKGEAEKTQTFDYGKAAADAINDVVGKVVNFTSGLVLGLFGSGEPLGPVELVNTVTFSLENVQSVEVNYISEGLTLLEAPGDQLIVKEYMNRNEEDLFASVNISGGSILIRNGRRQGCFGLRSRIEVLLPKSFQGSLTLGTISGGIKVPGEWRLAALVARTVSGEVEVDAVRAAAIRLATTSGSVRAEKLSGGLDLHAISGSIRVNAAEGGGSFKTISGGVRVQFTDLSGSVDASSVSGGVRLGLPVNASFEFEGRSVSGGIHTDFDDKLTYQRRNKANGFVGEAPYHHVRAVTTSGGVHVND
jgi:lia operon protein LiaG